MATVTDETAVTVVTIATVMTVIDSGDQQVVTDRVAVTVVTDAVVFPSNLVSSRPEILTSLQRERRERSGGSKLLCENVLDISTTSFSVLLSVVAANTTLRMFGRLGSFHCS